MTNQIDNRVALTRRPNPLHPDKMSPAARRTELCDLLGAGLARLHLRNTDQISEEEGDFPLHNSLEQSGSAGATHRSNAQ